MDELVAPGVAVAEPVGVEANEGDETVPQSSVDVVAMEVRNPILGLLMFGGRLAREVDEDEPGSVRDYPEGWDEKEIERARARETEN